MKPILQIGGKDVKDKKDFWQLENQVFSGCGRIKT